jgi:hypothetical protein
MHVISRCGPIVIISTYKPQILPSGLDGIVLGLAAKIRIQSDAIQDCHNKWVLEVEKEMHKILFALDEDWITGLASVFRTKEKRRNLKARIVALRQQIEYIVEYVRINVVAFRKITKKIDKRLGTSLSQPIMSRIARKRYFLVGTILFIYACICKGVVSLHIIKIILVCCVVHFQLFLLGWVQIDTFLYVHLQVVMGFALCARVFCVYQKVPSQVFLNLARPCLYYSSTSLLHCSVQEA